MENYNLLLNEIRSENRQLTKQFISNTKLYIINLIRTFTNNEDDAIKLCEKVYNQIIFSNDYLNENYNITNYIDSLIYTELSNYLGKPNFDLNKKETVLKVNEDNHDNSSLVNKPEVEQSFFETIKSLSLNEKIIYLEYYFKNGNIKRISDFFNINEIVTISYINEANDAIEEKSKVIFNKYKVNVNYSRFNAIKGTIGLCKNIINLNVDALIVGEVKKISKDIRKEVGLYKEDDKKEMDFKDYVKNEIKGEIDSFIRGRIKQALLIAGIKASTTVVAEDIVKDTTIASTKAAVTSAKVASGAKAAAVASTTAKGSIASKIIIGTLATAVIGTGGYVAVNEIVQENHVKKLVEEVEPLVSYSSEEDSAIQAEISLYSDDNDETMDVIVVNAELHTEEIDQTLLAAAKAASTIINGVSMDYEVNGDTISVSASADRNKIDYDLIQKVEEKTGIQLGPELDQMVEMFKNGDTEQVINILNQMGLSAGVKE